MLIMRLLILLVAVGVAVGCSEQLPTADCPATLQGWTKPKDGMDPHGVHSSVTLAGDKIIWDGEEVTRDEFQRRLQLAPTLDPVLHVLFDPSGARSCAQAEQVRDEIDRLADCPGKGRCGQGSLQEFRKYRDRGASPR